MDPSDKFQAGKTYRVEIKVISAKQNGANASRFVFPVTAYVNGKQVEPNDDWDMVYGNSTAVYIYYSFTVPAPDYIPGDVNGDGKVNVRDIGVMQQYMNGWEVTMDMDAADVNNDGKVNVRDIGVMQQYMNGWDVELI